MTTVKEVMSRSSSSCFPMPPCFTRHTDESLFETYRLNTPRTTATVYLLRPPRSLSSARPWFTLGTLTTTAAKSAATTDDDVIFRHPLTYEPQFLNKPNPNLPLSKLYPATVTVSHHLAAVDALIYAPIVYRKSKLRTLFALYNGGHLRVQPPPYHQWIQLSYAGIDRFDDVVVSKRKAYPLDRQGNMYVVRSKTAAGTRISETLISCSATPGSGRFGWRKRVVVDKQFVMYMVVRTAETLFQLYKKKTLGNQVYWEEVKGFDGNQVLFITRDHYFFRRASRKFPGREYRNCIVFTEGAFPEYGYECWEFTPFSKELGFESSTKENVGVFRLSDGIFGKGGEDEVFPKIDWSPPGWVYDALSGSDAEFQPCSSSSSLCQSGRGNEEDERMDLEIKIEKDGEVQSALMDSETPSLSATEEDLTRTLLSLNDGVNNATEEEALRKNITGLAPKACTSSTAAMQRCDSATTKFEGFDITSDLVPTLQKIWQKHGNILENCAVRSGDIIATSLESLAIVVRTLDDSSVLSLNDNQVDQLVSTLSDLRFIRFKVDWLIPFVEKAEKLHKSKPLVESLNNLKQLSSQAKERRANLLDELAKLDEEERQRKEEMEKVSKMIPFGGKVRLDEPIGSGT